MSGSHATAAHNSVAMCGSSAVPWLDGPSVVRLAEATHRARGLQREAVRRLAGVAAFIYVADAPSDCCSPLTSSLVSREGTLHHRTENAILMHQWSLHQ